MNMKLSIFVVKMDCLEPPSPLYHCVWGKICLDYAVSINVASIENIEDVIGG